MVGPGVTPSTSRAPSNTAVEPEPGTPSVSRGTNEPLAAALLAASGAATPLMLPLPKVSPSLARRFSVMYARKDATVAPAPGNTPTKKPWTELRATGAAMVLTSSRLSLSGLV